MEAPRQTNRVEKRENNDRQKRKTPKSVRKTHTNTHTGKQIKQPHGRGSGTDQWSVCEGQV